MLITDRTEADVLLGTEKGYYTCADLNRVEAAVAQIGSLLPQLGAAERFVTNYWGIPGSFPAGWPSEGQMERYLGNVRRIRSMFRIGVEVPESMDCLTIEGANAIEQVLEIAAERAGGILNSIHYSGEIFAGEELL